MDLVEDFGEYHASYSLKDGALVTDRRLILKLREVPVEKYLAYKKFRKAVSDDHDLMIALSSGGSTTSYQDEIWNLPYSENAEASRAYDQAREDYQKQNLAGQISSLTDAVEIDPKFIRAWLWLGEIYKYRGQTDDALVVTAKPWRSIPNYRLPIKPWAPRFSGWKILTRPFQCGKT